MLQIGFVYLFTSLMYTNITPNYSKKVFARTCLKYKIALDSIFIFYKISDYATLRLEF